MGTYARVITSMLPRAYETALAMGYAVDAQHPAEELHTMPGAIFNQIAPPYTIANHAVVVNSHPPAAAFATKVVALWREIAQTIPNGAAALIILHGSIIEFGAIACFPDADYSAWGDGFSYCEGISLHLEGDTFTTIEMLRVR